MTKAALINSCGADFKLLSAQDTMIKSNKKILSVCAVRTGCGKSQTIRKISQILRDHGKKFVIVRHPMAYGDLVKQTVQRYETLEDLDKYNCTIEEREEYEQHILNGNTVYAGVDYGEILKQAEKESEIVLWDGGNNDTPFFKPDFHIVVADALRPGHELTHYPGQTNLRMADAIVINKENVSTKDKIEIILRSVKKLNLKPTIIHADSLLKIKDEVDVSGKKAIVVEDGPTLTHGGMSFGAGYKMAERLGVEIIPAKKYAVGSIKKLYKKHDHLELVLPAMGYFDKQIKELEQTIENAKPDIVIAGTPIDLNLVLNIDIPIIHVTYYLSEKNIKLEKLLKEKNFI